MNNLKLVTYADASSPLFWNCYENKFLIIIIEKISKNLYCRSVLHPRIR